MPSSSQFIALASAAFSLTAAIPQRTALTQAPKPVNCTDISPSASYNSSCWDQLNVPSYLTAWQATTPTCKASSTSNNGCCKETEYWANCFLRLATGVTGADCTKLADPSCDYNAQINPSLLNSSTAPQARYVVRGIIAINDFFDAYYGGHFEGAIQDAALAASTTIGEMGDSLDYSGTTLLNDGNVLSALSLGLPFFGTSSLQNESFSTALPLLQIGRLFLESLQRTPNMSSSIWPNTTSAYAYPLRYTASQLPSSNDLLRIYSAFSAAILQATSSIPTFLNFSTNGTWITPQLIASTLLTNSTPGVDLAVLTYATSSTLAQQNFSITLVNASGLVDFVPLNDFQRALHDSGTNVLQTASDATIYWSPNTQRQYQFSHNGTGGPKNGSVVDPYNVLKLIEGNQWADLPTMFDGAYNCTSKGFVEPLNSVVHLLADGTLDMSCLSALPVYVTKGSICPIGAVQVNGTCPFRAIQ